MKSPRLVILLVIMLAAAGYAGWKQKWLAPAPTPASAASPANPPAASVEDVLREVEAIKKASGVPEFHGYGVVGEYVDPIWEECSAYEASTIALLEKADFGGLEERAQQALDGKLRFSDGGWKLHAFYSALGDFDRASPAVAPRRLQQLNAWLEARPKSVTAQIALAEFYINYAWAARGAGWASTVGDDQWKLFHERLTRAADLLKKIPPLGVRDPHYWRAFHRVALGLGVPRAVLDEIYHRSIALEPQYWGIYIGRATSLLPRWVGEPGEMESFADEAASVPGGPGLEIYARIAMEMSSYYRQLFVETKLQWPKVREGCEVLRKKYPGSMALLSSYAKLAAQAGDRDTARRLLEELGNRLDRRSWSSQAEYLRYLSVGGPVRIIAPSNR